MRRKYTKANIIIDILRSLIPGLVIFCEEMFFKYATLREPHDINILYIFLFSMSLGMMISALLSILPSMASRIVTLVLAVLSAVPYLVEYFIYRQFKVCYDINTITNGSEGAMNGFSDHITEMVFSPSGLAVIGVYFIPAILAAVMLALGKRTVREQSALAAGVMVVIALICYLVPIRMIKENRIYKAPYDREYSYEKAVADFGLATGLRLDIMRIVYPDSGVVFSSVGEIDMPEHTAATLPSDEPDETIEPEITEPVETEPDATPTPTFTPTPTPTPTPLPQPQVMDFDFEAMAEDSSGKVSELNEYVASLTPTTTNDFTGLFEGKNLIMITAEAFTAEAIDPELTPTLYRMATQGINFTDYYVPASAGTTGGEFSHITGFLPVDGGSSMSHYTSDNVYLTMGSQLDRLGYYGIMYHNNDYQFYSRHITHNRLGYSEGFVGYGNGLEDYITNEWPESDLEMIDATVPTFIDQEPFNVYYMSVSGHSGYSRGSNAQARKHWDQVENLECSDRIKAYIAANLEFEDAMTSLIGYLEDAGIADDTVIVITADHFPYGLDNDAPLGRLPYLSELYGVDNVSDYFTRDHNRLIIWSGCLESMDPIIVDTPVTSIDILPTLSNLFGLEWDSRLLPGRDVFSEAMPLAFNLNYDWKTDLGTYYASRGTFVPADESIEVSDEYIEQVRAIVSNKISFMRGVMNADYYGYLFDALTEEPED
ncbi:MAG: sulfatase-like hydrolase/transferase [Clostridiales bacterium]|nr:sulfatase-like hydrolase/transferase [Clostridiales bacterium]